YCALPPSFSSRDSSHRHRPSFPTRRSSDLQGPFPHSATRRSDWSVGSIGQVGEQPGLRRRIDQQVAIGARLRMQHMMLQLARPEDRKSTRLNSSHVKISYAVFCLKKKKEEH